MLKTPSKNKTIRLLDESYNYPLGIEASPTVAFLKKETVIPKLKWVSNIFDYLSSANSKTRDFLYDYNL
ncbi:hypothetical protein FNW52_03330 [Flavobacterium sp. ZT3R18]|uniref:hypothetical protein n=1 Tax=Flavobacterium sp. ZT3R18 TaxID=2594429 RepID=UPI00117B9D4C|nr:hypothetical protein [Flavobacterium sp. ZT3R18]TRX37945.1 hypothetical protein FNW52_03330 [Flavobacterium sp. ZT3R18]